MNNPNKLTAKSMQRKELIIEAAAKVIVENGIDSLTHRKVAAVAGVPLGSTTQYFTSIDELKLKALEYLTVEIDLQMQEYGRILAESADIASDLARVLFEYLSDPAKVRIEAIFQASSIIEPEIKKLTSHWFSGLVDMLATRMSHESARAIVIFIDGIMFRTATHEIVPDQEFLKVTMQQLTGVKYEDN